MVFNPSLLVRNAEWYGIMVHHILLFCRFSASFSSNILRVIITWRIFERGRYSEIHWHEISNAHCKCWIKDVTAWGVLELQYIAHATYWIQIRPVGCTSTILHVQLYIHSSILSCIFVFVTFRWQNLSTRFADYKANSDCIFVGDLRNVVDFNEEALTVTVEPLIDVGTITRWLTARGYRTLYTWLRDCSWCTQLRWFSLCQMYV